MAAEPVATGRRAAAYRSDIDGLRAVAVVPVVIFHLGVHAVRGGFVGVDVFFVISGYLITQVLIGDIERGRFSIVGFYERRIRRILPALLAVLAATAALYFTVSLPDEYAEFSRTLLAAAASVSNIYFWLHAGYFDGTALSTPLLHTWSLAVEEQFYVLWPICLYLMYRFRRQHVLLLTAGVALVSLSISAVGAFTHPVATFYLLHTRAWELLLGSLLALNIVSSPLGAAARNALSILGLALIAASVFWLSSDLPFPGLLALPPCLGAALIILAGRDGTSWAGRVLSWRPIVFIGLISYSLYLWHWPIVVLQRGGYLTLVPGQTGRIQNLAVIGASFAIAALSWRFIEQPFRTGPWRPSRRALMRIAAAGTAVIAGAGIVGWSTGGFPARYSDQELRFASVLNYGRRYYRVHRCFLISSSGRSEFAPECLNLADTKKNYLLLGDSHAADLWYGLNAKFPEVNFLQATAADCYPTVAHGLGERSYCTRLMDGIFQTFLTEHPVDEVVISARWTAAEMPRLSATLLWLKDRHIAATVLGPVAIYDGPLPRLMIIGARKGRPDAVDGHWDYSLRQLDAQLSQVARNAGAKYISMLDLLCRQSACLTTDDQGLPIYPDAEHFTGEGSRIVAQRLKDSGL
jgi:peptidoglycan/LPS O-acetylase OafA/YrhL